MKRFFVRLLKQIDRLQSHLSRKIKSLLGYRPNWPVMIATYHGYGNHSHIFLKGRVLKDQRIIARNVNSRWRALINNYKRFSSREIGGARLQVEIGDNTFELLTDQEGYFLVDGPLSRPLPINGTQWREVKIQVTSTPLREVDVSSHAGLLVPFQEAEFGFISDIDDTVLKTDVTSLLKLRMLYHTLLKSAALRQSFGQAAAFYQSLQRGNKGKPHNPVFYVSNSPWNLYDLLEEFLALNNLPKGPILLRDFGMPYQERPKDYKGHKHSSILRIIATYPNMRFVLIGDSGENDPYIYRKVAEQHPERIAAIYIRDVRSSRRARRIARLIEETGADIKLVQNYIEAAQDAAGRGLLSWDFFEQLRHAGPGSINIKE